MSTSATTVNWSRILTQGLIAGIVGGIVIVLFFWLVFLAPHGQSVMTFFIGDASFVGSTNPFVGALAHLCVSVAWGIAYAYIANTRSHVMARPWLSGIVFGAIVWLIMQFVLMAAGHGQPINAMSVIFGLIAHCFFFGLPVAWTVRGLAR